MIAGENRKSLVFGVPGLILQILQIVAIVVPMLLGDNPDMKALGIVPLLVGTALLTVGLVFYARAKGRHPAWGLMGLLSLIGLIVLACLKDLAPDGRVAGPSTPPPLPPQPPKVSS